MNKFMTLIVKFVANAMFLLLAPALLSLVFMFMVFIVQYVLGYRDNETLLIFYILGYIASFISLVCYLSSEGY